MTMDERIFNFLLTIPKGKVVTYGQIGAYLGNPKLARYVGNVLHKNPDPDKFPCFRVVNSKGRLAPGFAFGGPEEQERMLRNDGIEVNDGFVDLEKYIFRF